MRTSRKERYKIGKKLIELEMKLLKNSPKHLKKPDSLSMRPVNKKIFKK